MLTLPLPCPQLRLLLINIYSKQDNKNNRIFMNNNDYELLQLQYLFHLIGSKTHYCIMYNIFFCDN